jgi:hypothetical protein
MARKATAHKAPRSRNQDGSVRKRRTDRNHVIYLITCIKTGDTYVGVTRALGRAYLHSAKERLRKHSRDALNEGRHEPIHDCIRDHVTNWRRVHEAFTVEVLAVVRGKAAGHARELELINELDPSLNVEGTDRKARPMAMAS